MSNQQQTSSATLNLPTDFVEKYGYNAKTPLKWQTKRAIDITHAIAGLVLLSPVMLAISVAIKRESDGPVIFKQQRMGLNGKLFTIYKFRTMYLNDDSQSVMDADDYRITKTGKILRKYSLDEIPQLINILKGDMSIIGPRPQRENIFTNLQSLNPEYKLRLAIKPGLRLSAGKINQYTISELATKERNYIENWSLLGDLKIFLGLVKYAFNGKNY